MQQGVYLDYNATAPLRPEVAEAALSGRPCGRPAILPRFTGSAAPGPAPGRGPPAKLLAELVGSAPAGIVIFTSGGSEANNLALARPGRHPRAGLSRSAIEHDSVLQAVRSAAPR